jgi:hypothetical protein
VGVRVPYGGNPPEQSRSSTATRCFDCHHDVGAGSFGSSACCEFGDSARGCIGGRERLVHATDTKLALRSGLSRCVVLSGPEVYARVNRRSRWRDRGLPH